MLSLNFFLERDPLSLDAIRSVLTRLEDTIIFGLIERAQFAHNAKIYAKGGIPELEQKGFQGSWLEWFLKEIETFHAKARRYTSPDEYPFTPGLPDPVLGPLEFPQTLYPNTINVNPSILAFYTNFIVSRITQSATLKLAAVKRSRGIIGREEMEDDGNYGSAATIDVEILQAISKRVHYGKFVSESKFRDKPSDFIPHIRNCNREKLEALITKPEVEKQLLSRLELKANAYAQSFDQDGEARSEYKIDVSGVIELYRDYIIPLTKEVEVNYLLCRLEGLSQDEIDSLSAC